jgi:hypothetical protein
MNGFKDISGYEGIYAISTDGRLWSYRSNRFKKARIGTRGYCVVELNKSGYSKWYLLHRIVLETYVPKPEGKSEVNHINCVKTDNRVENLEWVTRRENIDHAVKLGLTKTERHTAHNSSMGKKYGYANGIANRKLTSEQVAYIKNNYKYRKQGSSSIALAKEFGVSPQTIRNVIQGRHYIV